MNNLQARLNRLNAQLRITRGNRAKAKLVLEILAIEAAIEQLPKNAIVAFKRNPKTRTLTLETPRRGYRAWVAKLSPELDTQYGGYKKQFIEPIKREFNGRKGEVSATFKIPIDLDAIYKDSDSDHWVFESLKGDIRCISYQEVQYRFEKCAKN